MLSDFSEILSNSFTEFSNSVDDVVSILNENELKHLFKDKFFQVWEVETDLYDDEKSIYIIDELKLYIAFNREFPLNPAKIYFNPDDFYKIGHIPHITYDCIHNICVFDEFVIIDNLRISQAILEQYIKAKNTLIDGIKKRNDKDFKDEFIAYWEQKSNNFDKLDSDYYSIIQEVPQHSNDLNVLLFKLNHNKKSPLLGLLFNKKENIIEMYKEYFNSVSLEFEIQEVFYLGDIDGLEKPPFSITIKESIKYVEQENLKKYKSFINNDEIRHKISVFLRKVDDGIYYLGWRLPNVKKIEIKGFRDGALSQFNIITNKMFRYHTLSVNRFLSNDLSLKRLIKRTSSDKIKTESVKILIAGLGSVGSNLIYLLNNINFPDFTLVDKDILSVENIGRHLLGFKDLNTLKVDAIKSFLKGKLPTQNIKTYNESIVDLFNNSSKVIESQDFIFLCIGKQSVEKWFMELLENGKLNKPIFILWVEPFLLGGQCLYIHPNRKVPINKLFYDVYKYKYSIIQQNELLNKRELFTMKESGCQSTFSPYSSSHLSLFISCVYPKIFKIIEDKSKQSVSFSWVGDTNIAEDLNIKLNFSNENKYKLFENLL
jgi:hypothetical protein